MRPKTTLDQWLTLQAVEQAGSFQAAASLLNKNHTTLIYAVKKLEELLDIELIRIEGRRAVLTEAAKVLLRRSKPMVEQARELEVISKSLAEGWESEITLTVDHLCDRQWLYPVLAKFLKHSRGTSVQVRETSLSATQQAVIQQQADIAIVNLPITGHMAEAFGLVSMVPLIALGHPLAAQDTVCRQDLLRCPQIVVRDLGEQLVETAQDAGWLRAHQRITVDNFDHAEQALLNGLGFAWLPEHRLSERLLTRVKRLPLQGSSHFQVAMHLVLPKTERTGPAAKLLYELLLEDGQRRT